MELVILFVALVVVFGIARYGRARREAEPNRAIVCPHCEVRGHVTCKSVTTKDGISGGKATGAVLTGGASMLATGLSRKSAKTRMHCGNCDSTWLVA